MNPLIGDLFLHDNLRQSNQIKQNLINYLIFFVTFKPIDQIIALKESNPTSFNIDFISLSSSCCKLHHSTDDLTKLDCR
ncbi:hypothetical protein BLOT_003041 [Blomia tropicalis]|nr:hypothetical protein BLOT_003041 [Blomia tropicalis]